MPNQRSDPSLPSDRLAAAAHYTAWVDAYGNTFVWGGGEPASDEMDFDAQQVVPNYVLGQLGIGVKVGPYLPRPRAIMAGMPVREISAGAHHMLMRTDGGEVWSCGAASHGQLGHGNEEDLAVPRKIEHLQGHGGGVRNGAAVRVSAGDWHSLVVSEKGFVYSFGSGINGRHGHGDTAHQWHPRALRDLEQAFIIDVDAGAGHSFAVSKEGQLWAWGAAGSGQLGIGQVASDYFRKKPTLIERIQGVRQASAGAAHSLVVTCDGALYSFGFGAYGRLGHGDRETRYSPKLVEGELAGCAVKFAAAGVDHSVVLTENGHLYTFGNCAHGKLGIGIRRELELPRDVDQHLAEEGVEQDPAHAKADLLQTFKFGRNTSFEFGGRNDIAIGHGQDHIQDTPHLVRKLRDRRVLSVAVGHDHTALEARNPKNLAVELYTFGSNASGQLGLPWKTDQDDKKLPAKVEMSLMDEAFIGSKFAVKVKGMKWRKSEATRLEREAEEAAGLTRSLLSSLGGLQANDFVEKTMSPSTKTAQSAELDAIMLAKGLMQEAHEDSRQEQRKIALLKTQAAPRLPQRIPKMLNAFKPAGQSGEGGGHSALAALPVIFKSGWLSPPNSRPATVAVDATRPTRRSSERFSSEGPPPTVTIQVAAPAPDAPDGGRGPAVAASSTSFREKPEGSFKVKPEGSFRAKPEGSFRAKPEGSFRAKPGGSFKAKPAGNFTLGTSHTIAPSTVAVPTPPPTAPPGRRLEKRPSRFNFSDAVA